MLLVAIGPIVLIIGILAVVKRRVDRRPQARRLRPSPPGGRDARSMSAPTARSRPTRSS